MASEIPTSLKKSVRAVLLSKLGGVLVSQFPKDYKALLQEQLPYKSLGFDNMEDFLKAMPDVVNLEYCKKDMAYRVFGVADPETFMSSWIQKSQNPQELSPRSRRKTNRSKPAQKQANTVNVVYDDGGPQLDDNNRYSVMYPRKKTSDFTEKDVRLKFKDTGDIAAIHIIERWIFVRYWKREEAIRAYGMFHEELEARYPASNKHKKNSMNQSNNSTSVGTQNGDFNSSFGTSFGGSFAGGDVESTAFGGAIVGSKGSIPENKKRNDSLKNDSSRNTAEAMNQYQVYIGNLAKEINETHLDEIVGGRTITRVALKRLNGGNKVVGFITFTTAKDAEDVIELWDRKTFHGRDLLVRPGKQSQDNSRAEDSNNSSINWKTDSSINESFDQLKITATNQSRNDHNGNLKVSPRQVHGTNITVTPQCNLSSLPTQVLIKNPVLSQTGQSPNSQHRSSMSQKQPYNHKMSSVEPLMPALEPLMPGLEPLMPGLEPMMPGLEPMMPGLEPMMPGLEPMMPGLEPMMPPLEPAVPVLLPMRQPASNILPVSSMPDSEVEEYEDDGPTKIFVGNFPAGTTEKELYALFIRYGVVDIKMVNNSPRMDKGCTKAFITLESTGNAVEAILDLDQTDYFDRNIKVAAPHQNLKLHEIVENRIQEYMSDSDSNSSPPSKSSSRNLSRNLSRSSNSPNVSKYSPYTDVTDLDSQEAAAVLETYGYIKSKVQASKWSKPMKPGEQLTLSVTAWLIEQYYFVQNGSDIEALRELQAITVKMQDREHHLGRTKGLGRCAALYKHDWYRAWILREDRSNRTVKVFYIDFGNICIIPANDTSIVPSWVWDLAPQATPVRIEVGSNGPHEKELIEKVITATVTSVKTVDKCPVYDVILNSIHS